MHGIHGIKKKNINNNHHHHVLGTENGKQQALCEVKTNFGI
jgi:hypothetical protein